MHTCHYHHAALGHCKKKALATHLEKLGAHPHAFHCFLNWQEATDAGELFTSQPCRCSHTRPLRLVTPLVSFSEEDTVAQRSLKSQSVNGGGV